MPAIHWTTLACALLALGSLMACSTPSPKPQAATAQADQPEAAQPEAAQQPATTRILLGSCNDQDADQSFWGALLKEQAPVFIYGGDNVYGDVKKGPEGKPQFLKGDMGRLQETYQILAQEPGFQQMRAQSTILPTWDDHDYGANDAGAEYPQREQAKALFLDFWQVPQGDPRRQRDGVYFSRTFGPEGQRVQVIMLDMRSFRSALKPTDERNAPGKERYVPDPDPAKTQLGAQQWAWLRQTLRQPAELRLLVSSIQVIADGHGWERWGLLPTERQRLYDLLAQTPGVILLSGDRHRGAFYRHQPSERGYPLLEMTSSSLNLPLAVDEEPGPLRLGPTYQQANYGLIEVDWGEGQVDLQLKDMQGATLARQQVKLDELSPSAP